MVFVNGSQELKFKTKNSEIQMFKRIKKKLIILGLMSISGCNIIKNITGNFKLINPDNFLQNSDKCCLLKNEECKVKVIVNNDYLMI